MWRELQREIGVVELPPRRLTGSPAGHARARTVHIRIESRFTRLHADVLTCCLLAGGRAGFIGLDSFYHQLRVEPSIPLIDAICNVFAPLWERNLM